MKIIEKVALGSSNAPPDGENTVFRPIFARIARFSENPGCPVSYSVQKKAGRESHNPRGGPGG